MGGLGKHQLSLLCALTGLTVIVADKTTRSLCRRGLMEEGHPGGFVKITANGLRALADAADRGDVDLRYRSRDITS